MFLPERKRCTLLFLQQVSAGTKLLFKKSEVPRCSIPMWPELAVAKLMPIVAKSEQVMKYLPDWAPGSKLPPRDFFWHVLNKKKPDYVKHIVADAIGNREG